MSNDSQHGNVRQLMSLMRASKREYEQYLANGRIFRHARNLRENNQKILDLISSQGFAPDAKLASGILDLNEHLEDWARCWDREAEMQNPADTDRFVFSGYKTYPKHLDDLLAEHGKQAGDGG